MPRERMKAFDALKFFAIFLVLWGHCVQHLLSSYYADEPVYRYIYSFHMPLFMLISGYFAWSSMKAPLAEFVAKKFRQLLLPCLSWGIFLLLVFYLPSCVRHGRDLSVKHMMGSLFYNFWFLKSCFLCYVLAWLGCNLRVGRGVWFVATLLLVQRVSFFQAWIMYPCFLVGMALRADNGMMAWVRQRWYVLFALFLLMLCFWDKTFWTNDTALKDIIVQMCRGDLLAIGQYGYRLYRLAIGLVGSLAFVGLFTRYIGNEPHSRLVETCFAWGQYTLGIYILQSIILESLMRRFICLDDLGFVSFNFLAAPAISVCVLLVCVGLIKFIARFPILNLLLFGNAKRA